MPGYGYAEVPKSVVDEWRRMIESFLRGRPTLQRTYVLLDARVDIKKHDLEIMALLDKTAVSYQVVLTKCDKVGSNQLKTIILALEERLRNHPAAHPKVMPTSSAKGIGIEELRAEMAHFSR